MKDLLVTDGYGEPAIVCPDQVDGGAGWTLDTQGLTLTSILC